MSAANARDPAWAGGAIGDGVHDDTTALQAAIDAVPPGGTLHLPEGTYKTSSALTLKPNLTIKGEGPTSVIQAASGIALDYSPVSLTTAKLTLQDFRVTGVLGTTTGLRLANVVHVQVERVTSDTHQFGILFNGSVFEATINNCFVSLCSSQGIRMLSGSNNCRIRDNVIQPNGQAMVGIFVDSTNYNTLIEGNDFAASAGDGNIAISCSGSTLTRIVGNFIENWAGAAIAANSGVATNLTITDNHLHATSAAAAAVILNSAGPNQRVYAVNNYMANLGVAGSTSVGFKWGTTTNIHSLHNKSGGSGTTINEVNGVAQTLADYISPGQYATGIATRTKAGTPVDGDFPTTPPDGSIVVDSTGNKIWARVGGVWKGVVIA